jgi:hypothetical protein
MKGDTIKYSEGYKYRTEQTYTVQTGITGYSVFNAFYSLTASGLLTIGTGYAWDGPSGPCPDWKCFQRSSLIHDVLYQMMRREQLPITCFHPANVEFKVASLEDCKFYEKPAVYIAYAAVEKFGMQFAKEQPDIILIAP